MLFPRKKEAHWQTIWSTSLQNLKSKVTGCRSGDIWIRLCTGWTAECLKDIFSPFFKFFIWCDVRLFQELSKLFLYFAFLLDASSLSRKLPSDQCRGRSNSEVAKNHEGGYKSCLCEQSCNSSKHCMQIYLVNKSKSSSYNNTTAINVVLPCYLYTHMLQHHWILNYMLIFHESHVNTLCGSSEVERWKKSISMCFVFSTLKWNFVLFLTSLFQLRYNYLCAKGSLAKIAAEHELNYNK